MKNLRATSQTPDILSEDIYLHIKPKARDSWSNTLGGLNVLKMAKSVDASVQPGVFIVKLTVSVPKEFFAEAMPSARITLESGQVVPVTIEQIEEAPEPEQSKEDN